MPTLVPSEILNLAKSCAIHWGKVNATLGTTPLTLRRGYTLATFNTDITALEQRLIQMPNMENAYGIALAERDAGKAPLKARLKQFRAAVQNKLGDSAFVAELPVQPYATAAESIFLQTFDDMAGLWGRINAATLAGFTPPLTLAKGYTLATFTTDLTAQRAAYNKTRQTIADTAVTRKQRDTETKALWERIKQYRNGCVEVLDETDPLFKTVP
jgi:predicted lipoprotein with Yx(FWY)xxD motif